MPKAERLQEYFHPHEQTHCFKKGATHVAIATYIQLQKEKKKQEEEELKVRQETLIKTKEKQ